MFLFYGSDSKIGPRACVPSFLEAALGQVASEGWESYLQVMLIGTGLTARKFVFHFSSCSTKKKKRKTRKNLLSVLSSTSTYKACIHSCRAVLSRDTGKGMEYEQRAGESRYIPIYIYI